MKTETTGTRGQGDSGLRALALTTAGTTIVVAFAACQALIGGTRLLFAFPAFGLLALAGVIGVFAIRSDRFSADRICLACTALFFAYMLGRAGLSPDHYLARFDIYSMIAGLIVYLLAAAVVTDAKRRIAIVAALLAAGVIQVIVGALQFRNGDNWMPFAFLQRFDYGRRASGFYMCPNHLAGLLEIIGVFGLSISLWSRWPTWSKLLVGYATLICYIGVMLTGSRGGYLSTLFSLFVFAILSLWIVRAARSALYLRIGAAGLVMIVVAAAGAFLVIGNSEDLTDRTKNVIDNKDVRIEFWRAALEQWKTRPLLGTGSRTYMYFGRQFRTPTVQLDPVYVHNDYLQLLAEYGVVGGIGFALFLIAHLRAGMISARRLGPRRIQVSQRILSNAMAINVGALAALAAYVVHSFFDFNLHIPANLLLMAFVLGVLANSGIREGTRTGLAAWPAACRYALAGLALFLAVQVSRCAPGEWYAERARTALRDHRPLPAMASALKGLNVEQANPQLFYYLGRAHYLSGGQQPAGPARNSFYAAALPAYESARQLAPMDETYLLELAFTLDLLSRYGEAEWLFGEARRLDPKSEALRRYYEAHLENWKQSRTSGSIEPVAPEPPA